jgi:thiol:disulfide interchange protein DsbD
LSQALEQWGDSLRVILEGQLSRGSIFAFVIVFAAGVLTSFTPCVYPMIPVTVTYIGGTSAGSRGRAFRRTLVYVLGMAVIYASLGAFAALTRRFFGGISTNPWVYFIVANIIILFGLNMLDVIPLRLPQFMTRGRAGSGPGYIGAFIMGAASGFVAAPCTAPVLGTLLLYVGSRGNVVYGSALLFTFAFGLGFLLLLIGTFTGAVTSLPRAGVWMVWVKKGFGFAMIALGEYFLIRMGRFLL